MPRDDQTSMNPSSSIASKDEYTSTTVRSNRRQLSGVILPNAPALTSESELWRAVICQAIRDIYRAEMQDGVLTLPYRQEVVEWMTDPDFDAVCHMSFVDPERLRSEMINLLTLPRRVAMKYAILLCDELTGEDLITIRAREAASLKKKKRGVDKMSTP